MLWEKATGGPLDATEIEGLTLTVQAHADSRFAGARGTALFRRRWRPDTPARGVLVNVHGLGDHSGLYPTVVEYFTARGFAVHAPDLRGNGLSPGQRGHITRWEVFREDLRRFLELVRSEEPGLPLFVLGNSLGGLIVLEYALQYPEELQGVIAAAPPLGSLGIPAPLLMLGKVMSRILPRFALRTGMDLSGLAQDPAVVEAVLADPHFHRWGTARLSVEVTKAVERVQAGAPSFPVPVLLLHGGADRMVLPDGTRVFMRTLGPLDRTFIEYPDGFHALFADQGGERVLADVERWIEAHLPSP
jgi:alpha-beta hydrolase superfamily lysophospholipase